MHYHHHTPNPHLVHMARVKWDVGQMLTPPKSKSPWEAMTSGSTGGWAAGIGPDAKGIGKWVGPVGTALAGLIPGIGPILSAGMGAAGTMGKTSGFQGTDKGWGNILPTLSGALSGWGAGGLTSGIAGGIKSALGTGTSSGLGNLANSFGSGFGQGTSNYLNTTTAPFKSAGSAISKMFGGSTAGINTGSSAYTIPAYGQSLTSTAMPGGTAAGVNAANLLGSQGATTAAATTAKSWGSSMLDFLTPANMAGMALMGASALPKNAEYTSPDLMGQMTAKLLGGQGITDIGLKSREELMKIMSRSPEYGMQAMDPWLTTAGKKLDEAYDQAEKDLTKKFKGYGATDSREFISEVGKLRANKAAEKSALQYEAQQREYVRYQNQQYDAVKTSLGVDDATMKDLLGLTQLSVEEAGLKYGAEAADIQSLREALGLGGAAMLNIGQPTYNVYGSSMLNY
jgi:hypothetical protein